MKKIRIISQARRFSLSIILFYSFTGTFLPAHSQAQAWESYRGNFEGTGYSPLAQINESNVSQLSLSWGYSLASQDTEGSLQANSQATPIFVDDVLYVPAADRVVALDPISGEEIWSHVLENGRPSRRGIAFWPGNENNLPRIFYTSRRRLVALNASTGKIDENFGQQGEIDLITPYLSVPLIYENVIVVGANTPRGADGGIGNARAFSAIDGEKIWEFESVPQLGDPGNETWEANSWMGRLGANAWPFYFTVDGARDLLFIPLASPIPFAYGGDRAGSNLYANSVVAVNIFTGEYQWHFQTIHHDLWDHDPPAPPVLFEIPSNSGPIPALAVTTKSGYLYILNRETGAPIHGVAEKPVAQSEVPGESTSATQPIPVITPPMARVSFDIEDLVTQEDTSPAHALACAQLINQIGEINNQGPFTPWSYRPREEIGQTTLLFPGLTGGPNWGGPAYDKNSGLIFVYATNLGSLGWMEESMPGSNVPYTLENPSPRNFEVTLNGQRMPCQKPPWGQLTAVNSATGTIAWREPIGLTTELPQGKQQTGRPGRAAAIVTASDLLFIASTDDNKLRALKSSTGEQLWSSDLGYRGNANPMTYQGQDNNQYVVIAATEVLLAYKLKK
jgi:quinoprotein glucose dehydrogenase